MVQLGGVANAGGQLQKAIVAVARFAIGLFGHRDIMVGMAGADERGLQIRRPEIEMRSAALVIKMLRRRQRTDPEI
jgi:hypothetical protein